MTTQGEILVFCTDLSRSKRFYECLRLHFRETKDEYGSGWIAEGLEGRKVRLYGSDGRSQPRRDRVLKVDDVGIVYSLMMQHGFVRFNHNEYLDPDQNCVRVMPPWARELQE